MTTVTNVYVGEIETRTVLPESHQSIYRSLYIAHNLNTGPAKMQNSMPMLVSRNLIQVTTLASLRTETRKNWLQHTSW